MRTFSSTVRCGNTAEIWNERASPMRAIVDGREPVISWPLKKICPRVGVRKCVSRLKQVVLPAPFGPIRAWIVPRLTERSMQLTATKPLNSLASERVRAFDVAFDLAIEGSLAQRDHGGAAIPDNADEARDGGVQLALRHDL